MDDKHAAKHIFKVTTFKFYPKAQKVEATFFFLTHSLSENCHLWKEFKIYKTLVT